MELPSSQQYHQWKLLDLRACPDTASGCATLDFTIVWYYGIVIQDVHGHIVEELYPTLPILLPHLSLPITQSPIPSGFRRTILECLDRKLGMDPAARVYLLSKILDARDRAVGEHDTTGFFIAVDLELTTTTELVIGDDDDLQPHRPRGASEAARQKLDAQSFFPEAGDQDGTCAICLEDLSSGRNNNWRLTKMPCAHVFHSPCVFRWLDTSATCPMCRRELED